jgi:hypothetical protein
MTGFSSSFLLLFYQISLGGLFAMAAAPFHELERGFFKSTGAVLFVIGSLGLWGKAQIQAQLIEEGTASFTALAEITLYSLFIVFFALYLFSLWGERVKFRARCFAASLLTGAAGLVAGALGFQQAPLPSLETLFYPLAFLLSALLLGGVTVGMLIGHWYLIDTGQSIEPFARIYKFFVVCLFCQICLLAVATPLLCYFGSAATQLGIARLLEEHRTLLLARILVAHLGPLVLSFMIWKTLQIPHTMAATGLFYIALLGVFVGEILSRQILALTAFPF